MIETDIFNGSTPEFFINMKSIPDKNSVDRKAFVLEEKRKGREGINVNGIYIPGNLYFHLNFYRLQKDIKDNQGKTVKIVSRPDLRDVDWIVFNDHHKATQESKIYTLFGLRQIGKSEIEVSLCLRELALYPNTEAIALFSSNKDKDTFVKKTRLALEHGEKFIFIPNIDKDWSKEEIRFGFTKTNNDIDLRGILYIYLTKEGKNIQVASGKTPTFALFDEIGKSSYRLVYEALEPALLGDFGTLRCAPIKTFTGGEVEKSRDAEILVKYPNPETQMIYDLNGVEIGGRFLSGHYRKDCKEEMPFSEYINVETNTWLDNYPIKVSNFEKAQGVMDKEIDIARKSPDPGPLILKRIFFPQTIDDVFLTENINPFPIDALQRHKVFLEANPVGTPYEIYRAGDGSVKLRETSKKAIYKYPLTVNDKFIDKDAPIIIYDKPKYSEHYNLHVLGVDPINQDTTIDGDSLASIYIIRRMHSDLTDSFQNTMVASWTGRPTHKKFLETLEMLQELYNGEILFEDSGGGVLSHFDGKNKGHVLMDTMDLQKEINPRTKAGNRKGLKAVPLTNERRLAALITYIEEDLGDEVMGLTRILDPLLIEELIAFNGMGKGTKNTDRIDAFSLAILQMQSLQKFLLRRPFIVDKQIVEPKKGPVIKNAFGFKQQTIKKRNPFG